MKKICSLLMALALALAAFTACGEKYTNVMTVEGKDVPAGIYLICQMQAYSEAQNTAGADADVLKATVEDMTGADWIAAKTQEYCRRYVWAENKFEELGLSFDATAQSELDTAVENGWTTYGSMYEKNGVGRESYAAYYANSSKLDKVFDAMYIAEGAPYEVTDEAAMAYFDENFSNTSYIVVPMMNYTDYSTISDEGTLSTLHAVADDLAAALNGGTESDAAITQYLPVAYGICGNTPDMSTPATYLSTSFVDRQSTNYTADFLDALFSQPMDTWAVLQPADNYLWVCRRSANYADAADFANYRTNIVYSMAVDDFDALLKAESDAFTVNVDTAAVKHYSVKKVDLTTSAA